MDSNDEDFFDNPRHSTKKELRPPGSAPKKKPPKLNGKKNLNRRLFSTRPVFLINSNEGNGNISPVYDESINASYFDQCFEQIKKIGEGSFGEVYKVRAKDNGQFYAIKRSKDTFRGEIDRDEKIAEVYKYLTIPKHDNIILLINAWEQDDYVYMQMELGLTSLDRYAEDNHEMSEKQLWNVLVDMLLALKNLHDNSLVHLDVKLENIIICDGGSCKLGDFGLLMNLKGDLRSATEGDAKYVSSELLEGKFTKAADVFSLGISMLELASDLELPTHGKLWHNLRSGIFPDHIIINVPRELLNIIRRMMIKDYKKRPSVKCLLKHPRIKSMLKQRREAAAKGLNLDGRLTPPVRTSTPLPGTPPRNSLEPSTRPTFQVIQATPPTGYSTPNMTSTFTSLESSVSAVRNQSSLRTSISSLDLTPPYLTPLLSVSHFSKQQPSFSSAKKLTFLMDD